MEQSIYSPGILRKPAFKTIHIREQRKNEWLKIHFA